MDDDSLFMFHALFNFNRFCRDPSGYHNDGAINSTSTLAPEVRERMIRALKSALGESIEPFAQATANVESDLEAHISAFEVPFDLRPIHKAMEEQRSNQIADFKEYNFPGLHSLSAMALYRNKFYELRVTLCSEGIDWMVLEARITDDKCGQTALYLDLRERALLKVDRKGAENQAAQGGFPKYFTFSDLGRETKTGLFDPGIYVARLEPITQRIGRIQ